MRGAIFIFVLGVIAGAFALNVFRNHRAQESRLEAATTPAHREQATLTEQARDAASSAKDSIADKLEEWNLSGGDIREDLQRTGSVVRTKAASAGEKIATVASKAKVIGIITTKYTLDKELSARTVDVDYDNGKVILRGTVPSEALIGKAVGLALDTDGVNEVQSLLTVQPTVSP